MSLRSLSWILLLAALGLGAWWAHDQPAVLDRLPPALRQALVLPSMPAAAPTAPAAASKALRKCTGAGAPVYTDGDCPAGTRAEAATGGTLSVLPAVRPAAPAEPAASAQSPLRKLAGPDDNAAQRERVLDQALHR
jgi:hypothetical protein